MRLLWIGVLLWAAGCAKRVDTRYDDYRVDRSYEQVERERSAPPPAPTAPPAPSFDAAPAPTASAPVEARRSGRPQKKGAAATPGAGPPEPASTAPQDHEEPVEDRPAAARMVHYDGHAVLRATQVQEALDAVAEVAERLEGRVERLSGPDISVRVPAARFQEAWEQILGLGDVLDRSVRADDVTEQFMAMDLRMRTLRSTRDRLVALLAKATDESEKLMLLGEITRVTEALDSVEARLRALSDLASFARISVRVVPREAFASSSGPELAGFGWIRSLSPFRRAVYSSPKRIEQVTPDGLVALGRTGPFIAESADGAVLWTLRVPNDPVGDGDFWIEAIEERIGEEFDGVTRRAVGQWSCLQLQEPGADEPYQWRVCVRPAGHHLQVAQSYFPGPEQVERYGDGVDAALAGGGA